MGETKRIWLGITDFRREDLIAKFNSGIKYLPLDEGRFCVYSRTSLVRRTIPLRILVDAGRRTDHYAFGASGRALL
jgi:hypothetical protein